VTKLDEAGQPWPLIQALCNHPLPLAAGSSAPEAARAAEHLTGADLVSLAMRGLSATDDAVPGAAATPTGSGMRNMEAEAPEHRHAN
jgi:hypothetical protein